MSSIKWEGHKFLAKTVSGLDVDGEISIDPKNNLVSGASYNLHAGNIEHGQMIYSYSNEKDASSLPDIIEKRVSQTQDPFSAAQNSFNFKILKINSMPNVLDSKIFMSSINETVYLISNGIPLTKRDGKFLSKEELDKIKVPKSRQ